MTADDVVVPAAKGLAQKGQNVAAPLSPLWGEGGARSARVRV
jgi:hypothetical protein